MIILKLTESQLKELCDSSLSNPEERNRKKCLIVYLRAIGVSCEEVARLVGVNEGTVTNWVKRYAAGGLAKLLEDNYRKPTSQLAPYIEKLKKLFEEQPPHTVNQAIELIFESTGIRLKHTACRDFLKKIGLKCRRCGLVPGKAVDDENQQKAQQEFHDQKLQPLLEEASQGKKTVLFVDAAHFVMGGLFRHVMVLCSHPATFSLWSKTLQCTRGI